MKRLNWSPWIVAVLLGLTAAVDNPASAGSITYIETATASGSLGGTSFMNALLTFTATADTNNVISVPGSPGVLGVNNSSAMIDIMGIGSATLTEATLTFVNTNTNVEAAGLTAGTVASPVVDLLGVKNSAFATYGLTTSIGPLSGTLFSRYWLTHDYDGAGDLVLTTLLNSPGGTFQAISEPSVPEPSTLVSATIAALCGLVCACRRRHAAMRGLAIAPVDRCVGIAGSTPFAWVNVATVRLFRSVTLWSERKLTDDAWTAAIAWKR